MNEPGITRASLKGRPGARLSLRILAVLAVLALCAELVASPLPWIGRVDGQLYVLPDVFTPAALVGVSRADLERRASQPGGERDFAFGPPVHFGPYDPDLAADGTPRLREAPSARHLFGTDSHGRDVFARVLYGTRVELSAAVVAVTAQLLLGAVLGALAGFVGGIFDVIVTRTIEALTAVPLLLLLVVVQALLTHPTLSTLLMAYAATRWTEVARLVRVEVMRVSQSDYVLAARALGATPLRVLVHHIVPNARAPLLVAASLGVTDLVLAEASLDFLGVGVPPILATWGEVLSEARHHAEAWWLLLYPGLALFLTLLLLYRIGDAFRDVLDPERRSYLDEARPDRPGT